MEECTSAEIGVGAAIAAGNQLLNGNCALLVKLPKIRKNNIILCLKNIFSIWVLFLNKEQANAIIKKPSPKRFVNAVFILALQEEEFWKNKTKKKEVTPNPSHPINKVNKLLPKIKKIIERIKANLKNKNWKIRISSFMYSLAKNNTEETIIINVLKNKIDKKSIKKLISKNLKLKNTYTSSFRKIKLINKVKKVNIYQNVQTI